MREAYIFDAVRTPRGRGRADGALHGISSLDMAAQCLRAVKVRNGIDPALVEDVILGIATPVGEQGGDLARFAALHAGYGDSVPGLQVHRFCASGLDACNIAAARISAGVADLIVAGGVESMSRVSMASDGGVMTSDPRIAVTHSYLPQGVAADVLATMYGYTRSAVDAYAMESQRRAHQAWQEGRFCRSIIPVVDEQGHAVLERDEGVRANATLESLAKLTPAFAKLGEQRYDEVAKRRYPTVKHVEHVHHAGNSSGVADGAAAVLLGSESACARLALKPRARVLASTAVGSDPSIMLTGPQLAADRVLRQAGLSVSDIDLWELNEAFASVVLRFAGALKLDQQCINVNGGAIALGHPLGATGAMLVGTLIDELDRAGLKRGMVLLCAAGGQASAAIIERLT